MPKAKQDTLAKLRAELTPRIEKLESSLPFVSPVIDNSKAPYIVSQIGTINRELAPHELLSLDELRAGVTRLPDGTKQFPNAPTGPVVNTVPNTTPAVPKEYGVGAVVRFHGNEYTVARVGDGLFFITVWNPETEQDQGLALYPRDVVLVTPAPV